MSLLEKARSQAQLYAARQLHNTAIFWADKALTLSDGDANDLATFSSLLHASGQHRRAVHALLSSPHLSRSSGLRYLLAKCYVAVQEWEEALLILKPPCDDFEGDAELTDAVKCPQLGDVTAASLLLQGQAHEGLGSLQVYSVSVDDCVCVHARACVRVGVVDIIYHNLLLGCCSVLP